MVCRVIAVDASGTGMAKATAPPHRRSSAAHPKFSPEPAAPEPKITGTKDRRSECRSHALRCGSDHEHEVPHKHHCGGEGGSGDNSERKSIRTAHSQFVTDVLRASFIVDTAEDFVKIWEGLLASSDFTVVRLKNKIGKCQAPGVPRDGREAVVLRECAYGGKI